MAFCDYAKGLVKHTFYSNCLYSRGDILYGKQEKEDT